MPADSVPAGFVSFVSSALCPHAAKPDTAIADTSDKATNFLPTFFMIEFLLSLCYIHNNLNHFSFLYKYWLYF